MPAHSFTVKASITAKTQERSSHGTYLISSRSVSWFLLSSGRTDYLDVIFMEDQCNLTGVCCLSCSLLAWRVQDIVAEVAQVGCRGAYQNPYHTVTHRYKARSHDAVHNIKETNEWSATAGQVPAKTCCASRGDVLIICNI